MSRKMIVLLHGIVTGIPWVHVTLFYLMAWRAYALEGHLFYYGNSYPDYDLLFSFLDRTVHQSLALFILSWFGLPISAWLFSRVSSPAKVKVSLGIFVLGLVINLFLRFTDPGNFIDWWF